MKKEFYDGAKLLSLMDLNGNKPEIYMSTSNRTAGKTTYFNRLMINHFLKTGEKFLLLFRNKYQLKGCSQEFFEDIGDLFFPGMSMRESVGKENVYMNLFLDDRLCGYATSLNAAEQVKRASSLLSDVWCILFDEFQSENNIYCPGEIKKFRSIHSSLARGKGKMVKYLPVFMVSNLITILNPYYISMGIYKRLTSETKFLKGNGWVLEQGYNKKAADMAKESGFNKAFMGDSYDASFGERTYLYEQTAFIKRMNGRSQYVVTLLYDGKKYGVREFPEESLFYVDERPDNTFPLRISVTTDDHCEMGLLLGSNSLLKLRMKQYFEYGHFRFQSPMAKEALLTCIAYT